ncbi:hypothetical protein QJR26_02115 [Clostridium baratii]
MAKFKILIYEKVTFQHKMVVEAKSENELDEVLDKIEREASHRDDVDSILKNNGIKVLGFTEDGSGYVEIEILDMEEVK